jgi:hypothetical protein
MSKEHEAFLKEIIRKCEALGAAELASDDGGDRYLLFKPQNDYIWAEVRARWIHNTPTWEITVGPIAPSIIYSVERLNDPHCKHCLHKKSEHESKDAGGCHGIADYERDTNSYVRCHCFDFEMTEVEG